MPAAGVRTGTKNDGYALQDVGVVYTPAFVAEDIVRRTMTPRLDASRTSRHHGQPLRLLDPACGGGVFLSTAFRYLLRNLAEGGGHPADLSQTARLRVLADHIFGVDIDAQAVAATRAVLADLVRLGDAGPTFNADLTAVLARNIRRGDALIDPTDWSDPDPPPEAFCWATAFPEIVGNGGFDVILGNPPYRRERDAKTLFDRIAATGFGRRWRSPRMDLWYYFLHRSLDLLGPGGRLGFIVHAYWTACSGAARLIARLRDERLLSEVVDLDRLPLFPGISGRHLILILDRNQGDAEIRLHRCRPTAATTAQDCLTDGGAMHTVLRPAQAVFQATGLTLGAEATASHPARLRSASPRPSGLLRLGDVATIRQGIAENPPVISARLNARYEGRFRTGAGVFVLNEAEINAAGLSADEAERLLRRYHRLRDLGRYRIVASPATHLLYSTAETAPTLDLLPGLHRHLAPYRPILEARREVRLGRIGWWHLHWPRAAHLWTTPKLIALQMADRPSFTLSETPCYTSFSTHVIVPRLDSARHRLGLLGWLNAAPVHHWLDHHAKRRGIGFDLSGQVLRAIPLPVLEAGSPQEALWDRLATLAHARLCLTTSDGTDAETRITEIEAALNETAQDLDDLSGSLV